MFALHVCVARACFMQAPRQAGLPCAGGQGSQPATRLWVTAPLALRRQRILVKVYRKDLELLGLCGLLAGYAAAAVCWGSVLRL